MTDILALDIATQLGWARGKVGDVAPQFGHLRFAKPGASAAAVFGNAIRFLSATLEPHPRPDIVIVESLLPAAAKVGDTNREVRDRLSGLHAIVRGVCFLRGVYEVQEATTQQVRGHFIGVHNLKRDAAKLAVIDQCRRIGWQVVNDDEADACALWHYAVCLVDPELGTQTSPLFNPKLRATA
jgi:crossover junction endodeoxyribonuclease RuvC